MHCLKLLSRRGLLEPDTVDITGHGRTETCVVYPHQYGTIHGQAGISLASEQMWRDLAGEKSI